MEMTKHRMIDQMVTTVGEPPVGTLLFDKSAASAGLRALVAVWQSGVRPTWDDADAHSDNHGDVGTHASRMADWACGDQLLALMRAVGL